MSPSISPSAAATHRAPRHTPYSPSPSQKSNRTLHLNNHPNTRRHPIHQSIQKGINKSKPITRKYRITRILSHHNCCKEEEEPDDEEVDERLFVEEFAEIGEDSPEKIAEVEDEVDEGDAPDGVEGEGGGVEHVGKEHEGLGEVEEDEDVIGKDLFMGVEELLEVALFFGFLCEYLGLLLTFYFSLLLFSELFPFELLLIILRSEKPHIQHNIPRIHNNRQHHINNDRRKIIRIRPLDPQYHHPQRHHNHPTHSNPLVKNIHNIQTHKVDECKETELSRIVKEPDCCTQEETKGVAEGGATEVVCCEGEEDHDDVDGDEAD